MSYESKSCGGKHITVVGDFCDILTYGAYYKEIQIWNSAVKRYRKIPRPPKDKILRPQISRLFPFLKYKLERFEVDQMIKV